jgi:predicted phage terminase large subunit-like protein
VWCRFGLSDQGYELAAHHLAIIAHLDALVSAETERLILLLPPGSAKSTFASVYFPAWWLARFPRSSIIAVSHTAGLAESFGRQVRSLIATHGARLNVFLRRDSRAAGRFMTEAGGEYFATGIHGAVTGRRADLTIIDDPISSFDEARSAAFRNRLWDWFRSELTTRLKPGGRIILVTTRWHRDDLAGRLIGQDGWTVLRLPALAELGDPLGRGEGDALWPSWEGREVLLAKQEAIGPASFAALFQQAPLDEAGKIFDVSNITFVDVTPPGAAVRGWDFAAGVDATRNPDWTAGVLLVRDEDGGFIVDDVKRVRIGPGELNPFVMDVAQRDGHGVQISIPRDPGQSGAYQALSLVRKLAAYRVHTSPEGRSKVARAEDVAPHLANGNLRLRRAPWNRAFIEELASFPGGPKDDQVDALSRAFAQLVTSTPPARFTDFSILNR